MNSHSHLAAAAFDFAQSSVVESAPMTSDAQSSITVAPSQPGIPNTGVNAGSFTITASAEATLMLFGIWLFALVFFGALGSLGYRRYRQFI